MKRIISLFLVLSTLCGSVMLFASCKKGGGDETVANTLDYGKDVLVDFNESANVTGCGLTAKTDNVKTAANAGEWKPGSVRTVEMKLSGKDISSYKETSVWINNLSASDVKIEYLLVSDNPSTSEKDGYSAYLTVHPGWHEYAVPMSELIKVGTPAGFESVSAVVLDSSKVTVDASVTMLVDSVYASAQKYGTTKGFGYPELARAVCFYEDGYTYLYDQLRYVLKAGDRMVTVTNDGKTAYVPVSVLAAHRGATDIVSSAEKVSFKYKGQNYEFTPASDIEFVGDAQATAPGRSFTVKPVVSGDYIMLPMEYCKELFGYELYYNEMGLIIFSDTKNIYRYNDDTATFNKLYDLTLLIARETYTGEELIDNMNSLYGTDGHGKLMLNQAQIDRLKKLVETDPIYASWFLRYESGYAKGTSNFNKNDFKFELSDGYRLLGMSRDAMNTIVNYAFLYRMTGNPDYGKKVADVMTALTKFKDPVTGAPSWHPEHFLDCGEIMYGFSIGYDWCYDYFTADQITKYEDAVKEMGYGAALGFGQVSAWWADRSNLEAYNAQLAAENKNPYNGYTLNKDRPAPYNDGTNGTVTYNFDRENWENNWNAVCNGGMGVMSLAFANVDEEFRAMSAHLLDCIMYSLPHSLKPSYAPDGGYPEGPGYWAYGTSYSIYLFSSLLSATGTDMGLINVPGFRESFYFINSFASFDVGVWNYHDAGEGAPGMPDMEFSFWFAANSGDTNMAKRRYQMINEDRSSPSLWDVMWYDASALEGTCELALDAVYYGIATCTFRSGWDTGSLFCGIHGGANAASHGQLDIGNFIFEVNGVRFFRDLGADNYNLTGNFGNPSIPEYTVKYFENPYRYWYYRSRAEGHNTLVIAPTKVDVTNRKGNNSQGKNFDQIFAANSKILRYETGANSACAIVDMGCAYIEASSGKRGLYLTDDRTAIVIQDEIKLTSKADKVYWFGNLAIGSKVTVAEDGKSAIIENDGVRLLCEIMVPEGYTGDFTFRVMAADYLQETGLSTIGGEVSRDGFQKLTAVATNVNEIQLAIVCRLLSDGPSSYTWTPMDSWVIE